MKKGILVCVLLVVMLFGFAACGGSFEGTYADATGTVSYSFSDGSASMVMGGMTIPMGEYEVKSGNLYIAGTRVGTVSRNTITIEGVAFTKR